MMLLAPQFFTGAVELVEDGLSLHLDAGQSASYGGSGQTWSDLTASGFDFHLGKTGTASSDDPTFNGTAGDESADEYFSHDGGDIYKTVSAHSGALPRLMGRDDTAFTLEMWVYFSDDTSNVQLFGNMAASGENGFRFLWSSATTARIELDVYPLSSSATNSTNISANAWHQIAISGTADGTTGIFVVDGAQDGTWSLNNTWTTGDSTRQAIISGREIDSALRFASGSRLAIVRAYNRALSAGELSQNYQFNKGRFGL